MLDRQTDTDILFALLLLFFKAILRLPHSTHETTSKVDNITIFMKKLEDSESRGLPGQGHKAN